VKTDAAAPADKKDSAAPADVTGAPQVEQSDNAPFNSVGFTVSSTGHAVSRRFKETLAPLELEPREFALLRAVAADEGASQQAIGERQQIPPSRMVAFVDALEARGLLERRHNPHDRRTRELHLTASGRKLLLRAFTLASELEAELCADLSADERQQLIDLLRRVGVGLGIAPGTHSAHADGGCEEPAS
jgi:DNA-binding MarR family transcriptional regulator